MKCWNCGSEVTPGARFCSICGAQQQQQSAPPPETPPQPGPGYDTGGGPVDHDPGPGRNNEMILAIFAGICAVLYGVAAVRMLLSSFSLFFSLFSIRGLAYALFLPVYILTVALYVWMCLVLVMFVTRRTPHNTDGLLILLAAGGVGIAVVNALRLLENFFLYRYGFLDGLGRLVSSVIGAAVVVFGIYGILHVLLGEDPLLGKTPEELKEEVRDTLNSLGQTASEAAHSTKDSWSGRRQSSQPRQDQWQAQDQTQWQAQTQWQPQRPVQPVYPQPHSTRLKDDYSLITYILLTLVTCGLYSFYFVYTLSRDMNIACAGDGKETAGLVKLILLTFLTCGFYGIYWYYSLGNRLAANAPRYGMNFQENGTTVLLWLVLGSCLCGIGSFVAMHILIKNANMLFGAYNYQHGM